MDIKVTPLQVERLYWRWCSLDKKQKGYLEYQDLQLPELADHPFGERIIQCLLMDCSDERMSFFNFVTVMARFSPSRKEGIDINSRVAKLRFLFNIYDLEDHEKLTTEVILAVFEALEPFEGNEMKVRGMVRKIFEEVDVENKNFITFDDFCRALEDLDINQVMSFNFLH